MSVLEFLILDCTIPRYTRMYNKGDLTHSSRIIVEEGNAAVVLEENRDHYSVIFFHSLRSLAETQMVTLFRKIPRDKILRTYITTFCEYVTRYPDDLQKIVSAYQTVSPSANIVVRDRDNDIIKAEVNILEE